MHDVIVNVRLLCGANAAKLAEEQVLVARLVVHYTSVMVKSCCAPGCKNRSTANSSIKFHRFPVDKDRRALWIAAVRRVHWQPTEHSVLCSAHFVSGSKSNDPLSPDYVPTLFNHSTTREKTRAEQNLASYTVEGWNRVSVGQRLLLREVLSKFQELKKNTRQNLQKHQRMRREQ